MKEVMQVIEVKTDSTGIPKCIFWKGKEFYIKAVLDHWTYAFSWNPEGLGHDRYLVEKVKLDYNRRTDKWLLTHEQRHIGWLRYIKNWALGIARRMQKTG